MKNRHDLRVSYDPKFDLVYIVLTPDQRSYGEQYGHVVIRRSMDTDEIVGFTIFDPVAREQDVRQELEQLEKETGIHFDFSDIPSPWFQAESLHSFEVNEVVENKALASADVL